MSTTSLPPSLNGHYAYTDTLKGIYYGPGCLDTALPELLNTLGAKKALIVTGKSLFEKTNVVKRVKAVLEKHNAYASVYYGMRQHSPAADIRDGLKQFKDTGADVIVSVGGGSPIDASKAMLYNLHKETGAPLLYQIAIPTTLSAAEYTASSFLPCLHKPGRLRAHLTDLRWVHERRGSENAELTLGTPQRLWLSSGLRALDHAVESLDRANGLTSIPLRFLAYGGLKDLFYYLPACKAHPESLEIRQRLQIAAWMSLFPNRIELNKYGAVGLSHSLGHRLGAAYSIPHGITSCMTLAPVVAIKADFATEDDKKWLADSLFYLSEPTTGSREGDIRKLSQLIYELVDSLGLKSTLTEYNVPREDIVKIARHGLSSEPEDSSLFKRTIQALENDHSHSHSHSIFSLSHSHSHGEDGPSHTPDAEVIVKTLKGQGDRGSRITVIGLLSNVGLTAAKGAAGWSMNSAALLADAGHSLSDLLGDFVTLFCWKLSRRPPSEVYPYGFGKFEVLGTATVSILLTAGAVGIGMHSWTLLADSLAQMAPTLPAGIFHDIIVTVTNAAHTIPAVVVEHSHAHAHSHALDPNAAWFAAISVIAKEWLYRATKRVADDEHSLVLLANAVHHRSDAYSSLVAFVAILGSWWFPHLPLDPIGGLLVSVLIFQQGWSILVSALRQLTDAGVSPRTKSSLLRALHPLLPSETSPHIATSSQVELQTENLRGIRDLRAMRAGALIVIDLVVDVPRSLSVESASAIEQIIAETLRKARKEVSEVRVKFNPVDE
ncbi:hypothetical protein EUX98_g1898 [Antrodiella citrinella]|uniref:Alcohol dehydrogenase iron-type/glycerol dehydrogenase GldA domain-containing protein n=1 Tax=Antrodiella citrinella TaxID=2447956 RepID=A0A4V3XJ97_9APHY|nr:hypothetical protein EUX98_g1898 [Antrodiella citrinella]